MFTTAGLVITVSVVNAPPPNTQNTRFLLAGGGEARFWSGGPDPETEVRLWVKSKLFITPKMFHLWRFIPELVQFFHHCWVWAFQESNRAMFLKQLLSGTPPITRFIQVRLVRNWSKIRSEPQNTSPSPLCKLHSKFSLSQRFQLGFC